MAKAWLAACLCAAIGPAAFAQGTNQGAPPTLPPLQQPATTTHIPGKIVLEELVTPDLAAAKQFYGGLFGWTFQDTPLGQTSTFSQAIQNGLPVAALVGRPMAAGAQQQPFWLTFFAATEVTEAETTAVGDGAKLLFGPHDLPAMGQIAVLSDPQGAVFGIINSASGDPADAMAPDNTWIWHALIARNPETEAAFYQTVFNYDVFPFDTPRGANSLLLASGNYARASVNPLPAQRPDIHPYWLGFVRVADVDAAAAKAGSLGGRVLVPPHLDRHGGRIAVIADPAGAPLGLMEWLQTAANPGSAK